MRKWKATLTGLAAGLLGVLIAVGPGSAAYAGPTGNPGRTYETFRGTVALHVSYANQWLNAGNSWYFGASRLTMQTDGNLVIYNRYNGRVLWKTNTQHSGATRMSFQTDGNLVLYTSGNVHKWASGTNSKCTGSRAYPVIALQEDSNLVIYCAKPVPLLEDLDGNFLKPLWDTHTIY